MIARATCEYLPLADNSVDLIFTDPPYARKSIHLYGWLAREAARVLKPGGFVLTMCGGMDLYENMKLMGAYLDWFWNYDIFLADVSTVIWHKRTIARNKPLIAFSKGAGMPRCNVLSGLYGGGNDKKYHHWGQDVESARYFIDCFSHVGDLVLDPFVGGGTTKVACKLIGRRCIAFDIDNSALKVTRSRMDSVPVSTPLFCLAGI